MVVLAGFLHALIVPVIGVTLESGGRKYVTPITGSIVTGGLRLCAVLGTGRRGRVIGRRSQGDGWSGAGGRVAGGTVAGRRGERGPDSNVTPIIGTLGTCGKFRFGFVLCRFVVYTLLVEGNNHHHLRDSDYDD
jgi:hypothetical protein